MTYDVRKAVEADQCREHALLVQRPVPATDQTYPAAKKMAETPFNVAFSAGRSEISINGSVRR
jgi:hypothetical protein